MGEARRRRENGGGGERQWTVNDVQRVISDPRTAGVGGWPAIISENDWVAANVRMIAEMGADRYLRTLLAGLHENFDGVADLLAKQG